MRLREEKSCSHDPYFCLEVQRSLCTSGAALKVGQAACTLALAKRNRTGPRYKPASTSCLLQLNRSLRRSFLIRISHRLGQSAKSVRHMRTSNCRIFAYSVDASDLRYAGVPVGVAARCVGLVALVNCASPQKALALRGLSTRFRRTSGQFVCIIFRKTPLFGICFVLGSRPSSFNLSVESRTEPTGRSGCGERVWLEA